ncbi:MAG: ubiquinone/menaquinone biosynthesis methyltransferase [Deltaproteobacteria bacterium]|nr:ubiquinone/menaquinone biosynthesis methyltransferase [Deltaproteobacteria bacterium]
MTTETTTDLVSTRDGSGAMFDRIAPRYDLLNRLMSLGLDASWRRRLVRSLLQGDVASSEAGLLEVLDVATGTADVAITIAKAHPGARVVGLDPSREMLAVGRRKVTTDELDPRVSLIEGDAQKLPFEDGRFAASCISFGIRNVPDRLLGLREMRRVTRPGGRVVVLELNEPERGWLAPFARLHVHHIVPRMGAWLSGSKEYRYLQRSIQAFPAPDAFAAMMVSVGLTMESTTSLGFGSAHLFVARV